MRSLLAIRFMAVTVNEQAVFSAWPTLCELAWPDQGSVDGGTWVPTSVPPALAPPISAEKGRRGVQELADALIEQARFGNWSNSLKDTLADGMARLETASAELAEALGNWQGQQAVKAAAALEDALDDMQQAVS
ncbi:hypothetical protein LJC23_01105 [Desulfovibrio sp. OttesenSCG-928-I05]|nr:hypothetical protein [Desulfovibrio sp. OttesenSCG-928-I05]